MMYTCRSQNKEHIVTNTLFNSLYVTVNNKMIGYFIIHEYESSAYRVYMLLL